MRGAEELGQAWRMSSLSDFFPLEWMDTKWMALYVGDFVNSIRFPRLIEQISEGQRLGLDLG